MWENRIMSPANRSGTRHPGDLVVDPEHLVDKPKGNAKRMGQKSVRPLTEVLEE
jgi:hypothetical protein